MDRTLSACEMFAADLYATETTGIVIERADDNYALCSLELRPGHMNANGAVMGGAIFTLADFTFAVAANPGGDTVTVTLSSSAQFLRPAKGKRLTAEAACVKDGRSVCVMDISVTDDAGELVARVTNTGMKTRRA